ncbi:uncharacterized protein LOC108042348 [Drosophila rhopaloa]|uniref:DNA/RNA non-specific endonuclease domain-containing protein n=1 Tax=Drosophila rhopaloa TaxID=1041015 RepID=A0ABM5H828_DRORH|nr:uncharacterized protein LOC108042348 [Drosophila rhopaloa]
MIKFIGLVLAIVILREIRAREAIASIPDVGQIIKDLDGLQIDGATFQRGAPCRVDMQKDLPRPDQVQPLYLRPGTDLYWLPNADGQLEIPRGASIEMHCSHPFAPANGESLEPELRSIRVKCVQDTTFEWTGSKIKFRDFVCSRSIPYTVERLDRHCVDGDVTSFLYRVGYDTGDGRFVATMELCHDPSHLRTHYARHHLSPANVHFQRNVKRLKFSAAGHFTGFDMARIYSHKSQEKLMAPAGLIDVKSGLFLARGHLAAKADLIYASQQRSSFNYVNVAPQWQSFNGGQWAVLEDSTRRYVASSGISASVYTGTYGEMKVAGSKSLYLTTDANDNGLVTVPQLFYRVLVDDGNPTRGIALLGVNNPHATLAQIHESYIICDPVEELVQWLSWLHKSNAKGNLKKGYLYACSVADLARVVGQLPRPLLQVDELLT